MFELLFYILFVLSNVYFDLWTNLFNYIIIHNQFFINVLSLIFYAYINEDFDLTDTDIDSDDFENDDSNKDLDNYINENDQDLKNKKK